MRVLFVASEIFPYAKTGGLGDVAYSLPKALSTEINIVSVMPLYSFMDSTSFTKEPLSFSVSLGKHIHETTLFSTDNNGLKTYFIYTPTLSDTQNSGAYENDSMEFGVFCMAVVELAKHLSIDILHLNDWHSALCALYAKEYAPRIKTLFTIHNLAYQGLFSTEVLEYAGIDKKYYTLEGVEFYDKVSFVKAGIAYCDALTTVSPTYAKEILTPEFGFGLHNFLKLHSDKLLGILNGIDYEIFNPSTDSALKQNFDVDTLNLKHLNKEELLKELPFKEKEYPLFIMVSRLVEQKGFELLLNNMEKILSKKINLVILADGNNIYKSKLEYFGKNHNNLYLRFGYEEQFAHLLYGAGDFLLMPSLFEPCGLNQFIAMRYGCIPVVHGVGGLHDSVHEEENLCGMGIVFKEYTDDALLDAIKRAHELKKDKINSMRDFNMRCDFSFKNSAKEYIKIYKELLL